MRTIEVTIEVDKIPDDLDLSLDQQSVKVTKDQRTEIPTEVVEWQNLDYENR